MNKLYRKNESRDVYGSNSVSVAERFESTALGFEHNLRRVSFLNKLAAQSQSLFHCPEILLKRTYKRPNKKAIIPNII